MTPRALLVALLVLGPAHAAIAQRTDAHARTESESEVQPSVSVLPLIVNSVPAGDAVVLISAADVWVEREALVRARVVVPETAVVQHDNRQFVSLARMADVLSHEINDRLELVITAKAAEFALQKIELGVSRPRVDVEGSGPSLYVNYGVEWSSGIGRPSLNGEAGLRMGAALFTATAARTAAGNLLWGGAQAIVDDDRRLRRWTFGEQYSAGGVHRGSDAFTGVTVSRAYDLNPYFIHHATPGLEGVATTPSTVEIYANGSLVRREQVQPGVFQLSGIPATAGAGQLEVVVRDAFGRAQVFSSNFYETPSLLDRGLHEFSYSVGSRGTFAQREGRGPFLASAFHRYGFSRSITLGGSLSFIPGTLDVGTSIGVRFPFAELGVDATTRSRQDATRTAVSMSIVRSARRASFGGSVRVASQGFSEQTLFRREPLRLWTAFASWNLASLLSLSTRYSEQTWLDTPTCREPSATASGRAGRNGNFQVTMAAACREDGKRSARLTIGYSLILGQRTSAHVNYSEKGLAADLQRPLGNGRGQGYRVHAEADGETVVEAQTARGFGRYEAMYSVNGDTRVFAARATGSMVVAGGSMLFSRPVQDAFAVVRVPGVRGVRVYASGQEVGRTNKRGDLLVPGLLASYANELSIADQDVPLSHSIETVTRVAAPRRRSGAVVSFAAVRRRAVLGLIRVAGSEKIPAYGQLSVGAGDAAALISPLSSDGMFYLDNLQVGRHAAEVIHGEGRCTVSFDVPETDEEQIDLGTLVCAPIVNP